MTRTEYRARFGEVSQAHYSEMIGGAVSRCYGVAGMGTTRHGLLRRRQYVNRGVRVYHDSNGLMVDLHVVVHYGLNISTVVRSVINKVCYTVEQSTGQKVRKVNVFVDGML